MPTIASGPRRTDTGPQLPYSIRAETTWSFPQNISGLSVWFDASDATTINSIGSNLLSWRSKDSNAIIMSNGNYPLGPTFIQNARNGLPVVRFDGTTGITVQRSNNILSAVAVNTVPSLTSIIFNGSSTTIPDVSISNVGIGRNGVISVNSSNGSLQANFNFNQGWLGTRNGAGDPTSYYDGYLSEIILYNRSVTFAERQQIESYLLNKWNI